MEVFRSLVTRLGLTVNEKKTRLARLPEERFDFLGYTVGRFYGKDGKLIGGSDDLAAWLLTRDAGVSRSAA